MMEIRPFRGILYDKEKVKNIAQVLAPPYDVISPEQRDRFYQLHLWNIVQIVLGKELPGDNEKENKYARAGRLFRKWLAQGIVKKQSQPAIYIYQQEYVLEGKKIVRKGFFALMRVVPFGQGVIFPHEEIFPEPQTDRYKLLRASLANFSAVFSLYSDSVGLIDNYLKSEEFLIELIDQQGVKHKLEAIRDKNKIEKIADLMQDKKIFIADGHHRYTTAVKFSQDLEGKAEILSGKNYTLMYFLNMDSGSATILPVHRAIGNLDGNGLSRIYATLKRLFTVDELSFSSPSEETTQRQKMLQRLRQFPENHIFGLYAGKDCYLILTLKNDRQFQSQHNTEFLDGLLRDTLRKETLIKGQDIDYVKDTAQAIDLVRHGRYQLVFFLQPTPLEHMIEVALSGRRMPPKSTYFYPKLLSGVIMRDLRDAV